VYWKAFVLGWAETSMLQHPMAAAHKSPKFASGCFSLSIAASKHAVILRYWFQGVLLNCQHRVVTCVWFESYGGIFA
jgi:hypothetical protein